MFQTFVWRVQTFPIETVLQNLQENLEKAVQRRRTF